MSEVLSKDLSALNSLKNTWIKYKSELSKNIPLGFYGAITGVLPLLICLLSTMFLLSENSLLISTVLPISIFIMISPVLLVPFRAVCKSTNYHIDTIEIKNSLKAYGNYLILNLLTTIYYIVIYLLCKGDPILNLVWLVLALYWIAITVPIPVLMERYQINSLKALALSYRRAGDVRWNLFLLVVILFVINILALLFLFIGLIITLPYTWYAIRDYVDKMIEFEVFN
jgi:hypothetical protein